MPSATAVVVVVKLLGIESLYKTGQREEPTIAFCGWTTRDRLAEQRLKLRCGNFPISEAVDEVIVHHADCLHVRVDDGGTDEAESAALEILAERVGLGGGCWNLSRRLPVIKLRPPPDKMPAVGVLRIEEAGKNILSLRLDDPCIRRIRYLPPARNGADFVSLDHDYGILDRRPAVAVNQRAAFYNQRRSLLRLRGCQAAKDRQKQK